MSSSDLPLDMLGWGYGNSSGNPARPPPPPPPSTSTSTAPYPMDDYPETQSPPLHPYPEYPVQQRTASPPKPMSISRRAPSSRDATMRRNVSYAKKLPPIRVTEDDAYSHALRVAYLHYLLQPRQKRIQHVANTSKKVERSGTSINDMVSEIKTIRDSKSTRFPHGFMAELDKRITNVLIGKEKGIEYQDAMVKRTFANFLNEFKQPQYRKQMEKDRQVESLLLIFYSRATSELQKGRPPEDDGWKLMVDRHVALFVRLISSTLHTNDWTRDRPELSSRLKTLETKLLQHDQDLASASTGSSSVEVEIPRSYEVKDMPLVIRVCSLFAKPTAVAQNDINAHKDVWTEKAALRDLKEYQNLMMLNSRVTLRKDDFDLDSAFEAWRKGELADLSAMMLDIIKSNPELAKTSSDGSVPGRQHSSSLSANDPGYSEIARQMSAGAEQEYAFDQPVDMSHLNLGDEHNSRDSGIDGAKVDFTFIPPDPRPFYRAVLRRALEHDLADTVDASGMEGDTIRLLSRHSSDLLNELALRWRIPLWTRVVLFLDIVKEKFVSMEISPETLDAAFTQAKEPPQIPDPRRGGKPATNLDSPLADRTKWTITDHALYQSLLSTLHDALLRAFHDLFQHCYESKAPSVGVVLYILDTHVRPDPLFNSSPEDSAVFAQMVGERLREKAGEKYSELLAKHIGDNSSEWEFYHVMQLGKAITGLVEKVQKRYRRSPEVLGVNPTRILVEEVLPSYAGDAKEIIIRIIEAGRAKGEDGEVPVQDGFEMYRELVTFRRHWQTSLPDREFPFSIEALLQEFVWKWLALTDSKILAWIEGAVAQDTFEIRQNPQEKEAGLPPTEEERRSQSVLDVYRIFNQSIEQVVSLQWDDDLMYARFMTALSKSIGKGVARYCELLELKFGKEMDRQTPEQEARAQQTQREKWLSAARDAWVGGGGRGGSGEKIEPFQFWPQSFVKINDVEFATLQLDQVEKEINVDACAEVIQRLDPPPPAANLRGGAKGGKFMFTIKILEAEDLKAGDANGSSDPYVVLGDEYQKRLAKTRTVYQSLNPRWDETVDIITTGPLNIVATVWDWDLLGDHDCLGRTSLKLDPAHFNDFLPREYWLDLDTQGRVLVRVSMEGERDDIQFYFGKAFRTLKRTERDMARKVTEKLSAYIQQCLSRRTLKSLTGQGGMGMMVGGVTMSQARGYFTKISAQVAGRPLSTALTPGPSTTSGATVPTTAPSADQVSAALKPLLTYFDDNFAIMKQTLTASALITIMTRLWKDILSTLESLLVPPLSDKLSTQRPLNRQEVDIIYRWLEILFGFFHAYDEEEKVAHGVPLEVLRSPKYFDLQSLNFYYFDPTDDLIRASDGIAQQTARRQQETAAKLNRFSAPAGPVGMLAAPSPFGTRRTKSIMLSRNLGTMREAKKAKRAEAQADPNDDMILRILRMRPEAERYLRDRSRQKERLAAAAAAEAIVRQSLMAGRQGAVGRGGGGGGGGRAPGRGGGGGISRQWATIRE